MSVEFIYINRIKRRVVRIIQLFILTPITLFFMMGVNRKYGSTLQEDLFGVPEYWQWISIVGLILMFFPYFFLYMILKVKNGRLIFQHDKIQILNYDRIKSEYLIKDISNVHLEKDIPFKGDERFSSQKASKLSFNHKGKNVKIEFTANEPSSYQQLNDYLNKEYISDFKESYRPQPIVKWLDF